MDKVVPWGWFIRKSDKVKCAWVCRELRLSKDVCALLQMQCFEYICVSDVKFERLCNKQPSTDALKLVYQRLFLNKFYRMSGFTFGFAHRTKRFLVSFFAALFAESGIDVCMMLYSVEPEFIITDVKELAVTNTKSTHIDTLFFEETKSTVSLQDCRGEFPKFTKPTLCITWDQKQLLFNIQP